MKGQKTGGRTKGVPNRRTAEIVAKAEAGGLMPLDFMLSLLRNDGESLDNRMWAAQNAAPYVHARLQAVDAKMDLKGDVTYTWKRSEG